MHSCTHAFGHYGSRLGREVTLAEQIDAHSEAIDFALKACRRYRERVVIDAAVWIKLYDGEELLIETFVKASPSTVRH